MLHHLSIPAREPERTARALAELLGGDVTPFGPLPGSWIAWARDEAGTAIDCLPLGTELRPGEGAEEARFAVAERPSPYGAVHAALSVERSEEEIHPERRQRASQQPGRYPSGLHVKVRPRRRLGC
jgi:hypothetical protein